MMQIVYFSQKEQFLEHMASFEGEKVYVTPSPAKADGLRERLRENASTDVITIAKFTANLVSALWSGEERPDVKRKADLLLIFGILKNKHLPELGYEQFVQAYNLFSDLRSFTLNEDALSSVMQEQPEEIRNAVKLFWQLLELTGYLDEHGTYQKIAEELRSAAEHEDLNKTYIFWGFQHLNGQQVDLLKALAIRYPVVIPFPLSLKEKLKRGDWVSWLKELKVEEQILPEIEVRPKAEWLNVNSREMALNLKKILKDHDQVVLGVSQLTPSHLDLVPSSKVTYKIPHQLIDVELKKLADDLKINFQDSKMTTDLWDHLSDKLRQRISLKEFKAVQLYQNALGTISELTDEKILVDSFFLKLLYDVVSLNQPRSSYIPVSQNDLLIDLKDMSSLEFLGRSRRIIFCVDDRFDEIQSLGQNYSESIQKSLSTLGPLKRNELELLFKQWEFRDLFSQAEVIVMMSPGTLKHSLIWKRLFQEIVLNQVDLSNNENERKIKDAFKAITRKQFDGSFSASKFQSFLDCPRKFYFSYVDKVFPSVALEKDFDPMISGTISHKIIEVFYERKLPEDSLPALVKEIMQRYILERKLRLPKETYLQHEIVFNHRALNGIQFLKRFEEILGSPVEWKMEQEFSLNDNYKLSGKIDCVGISGNMVILIDFKSTAGAASSNAEVEELESLQLWAYALAASKSISDFRNKNVVLGYVSLDKPAESNLLHSDEDLASKLKVSKLCRQGQMEKTFTEVFDEAVKKMNYLVTTIRSEKDFRPLPRKTNTCRLCDLNKVCIKSELSE